MQPFKVAPGSITEKARRLACVAGVNREGEGEGEGEPERGREMGSGS